MNDFLRKQVKLLHAIQGIKYKEVAEYLEIPYNSFLNWLYKYYNFGDEKLSLLKDILSDLKEVDIDNV